MAENKTARTPTDSATGFIDGVWYGPGPTYISSKPSKQWIGLTDEEIQDLSYLSQKIDASNSPWFDRWGFAKAIEQALKEKNQ